MGKEFICTRINPVVETNAGKLRGFIIDGTHTFHGIKYANAKRFQKPTEVEPWEGIRDALTYGYVCPLLTQRTLPNEVLVPHRYWLYDENCQYLNIWTQSLDKFAKKPVMLWLHGGGFMNGSSIEHLAYDGENLSKFGDVVVVSVNHRLNVLGYLNMSDFGDKYANSGNAGQADIVAALQWIQKNIQKFGGDPQNVTIFGQSGGGMKVAALVQTQEADGLFHKAIVQSGVVNDDSPAYSLEGKKIVKFMLEELGLHEGEIEKLETVPYSNLAKAFNKAVSIVLDRTGSLILGGPLPNEFYSGDARQVGFSDHAKTIPVLIGSTFGEFNFEQSVDKTVISDKEVDELLLKEFGGEYKDLKKCFAKAYPERHMADLLDLDERFRGPTKEFITKRSMHQEAPIYSYVFAFEFDYDNGKPAWHCSEIPFVFHNSDKVPVYNMPGVSDLMEENVCRAWVNFARTGNPNHDGLPEWPVSIPGDEATMIFMAESEVRHNHDNDLIKLHSKVAKNPFETMKKMEH